MHAGYEGDDIAVKYLTPRVWILWAFSDNIATIITYLVDVNLLL